MHTSRRTGTDTRRQQGPLLGQQPRADRVRATAPALSRLDRHQGAAEALASEVRPRRARPSPRCRLPRARRPRQARHLPRGPCHSELGIGAGVLPWLRLKAGARAEGYPTPTSTTAVESAPSRAGLDFTSDSEATRARSTQRCLRARTIEKQGLECPRSRVGDFVVPSRADPESGHLGVIPVVTEGPSHIVPRYFEVAVLSEDARDVGGRKAGLTGATAPLQRPQDPRDPDRAMKRPTTPQRRQRSRIWRRLWVLAADTGVFVDHSGRGGSRYIVRASTFGIRGAGVDAQRHARQSNAGRS